MPPSSPRKWRRNPRQTSSLVGMVISKKSLQVQDDATATTTVSSNPPSPAETKKKKVSSLPRLSSPSPTSSSEINELAKKLMVKQKQISEIIRGKLVESGGDSSSPPGRMDFVTEQEIISTSFVNTIHKLMLRVTEQDAIIQDQAEKQKRLECHIERTVETLDFKTSEVANLKGRLDSQQDELSVVYSRLTDEYLSQASPKCTCSIELQRNAEKKDREIAKTRSKLTDAQFLLCAYKARCDKLEAKLEACQGGKQPIAQLSEKACPSFMPTRLDAKLPASEDNGGDTSSVDLSLFV